MSKIKIFLTGGSGMVGQNILNHLNSINFTFLAPKKNELDLKNFEHVQSYISFHSPEIIIHAAGLVGGIHANVANPVNFLVENVDIGRNIILAARDAGIRKLLNLSSSCMYPRNALNPLTEDMILKGELEPTNEGYALAKIFANRLCEYIHKENVIFKYKTLIPCNLYGCYDKFDPKHSHLIPAIIHKIHQAKILNHKSVEIWGDGSARREFMYAGDLADLVLKVVTSFDDMPDLMNVGLGFDYSINEYYQSVARVIGWNGKFNYDLSKPVGMKQKLVSTERLQKLGWKAATNLDNGIAKTYSYYLASFK